MGINTERASRYAVSAGFIVVLFCAPMALAQEVSTMPPAEEGVAGIVNAVKLEKNAGEDASPKEKGDATEEAIRIIELEDDQPEFPEEGASDGTVSSEAKPEGVNAASDEKRTGRPGKGGPEQSPPRVIEPLYVRPFTGIERGRNDSNPLWSPSGDSLAFERSIGDRKEIIIATTGGDVVHKIYYQESGEEGDFGLFMPGFMEETSYNSGISWSPDGGRFVFMSNGGTGNYDLYLNGLGGHNTTRLTLSPEKDGHAHWSPVADRIVFVSGREGKADVYLMDIETREITRLTKGAKSYLYPQWSPDGRRVVMIYGSNENHDVYLIDDITRPFETMRPLTTWSHDDLRPVWSPDGKLIAFYSNYNREGDPKAWSLVVIAPDGPVPAGAGLAANVVATDIIPDIERGPAWMPDSRRIVYVKADRYAYNPLYIVDVSEGSSFPLKTGTRMNHDVVCSARGTIAFRAQVEQWDHMFVAKLKE